MDTWNTETTMQHERVPAWLVEFAQLWTRQSTTNLPYQVFASTSVGWSLNDANKKKCRYLSLAFIRI